MILLDLISSMNTSFHRNGISMCLPVDSVTIRHSQDKHVRIIRLCSLFLPGSQSVGVAYRLCHPLPKTL